MEISLLFAIYLRRQKIAVCRIALTILLFTLLLPKLSYAQKEPEYYEISVSLNVQGIGITEMPVAIRGEVLYLPITDVFDFLKIKNVPSAGFDSISGFLIDPQATYLVDRIHQYIRYQEKVFNLKPDDLIRTAPICI